jgi:hypothetical protein
MFTCTGVLVPGRDEGLDGDMVLFRNGARALFLFPTPDIPFLVDWLNYRREIVKTGKNAKGV